MQLTQREEQFFKAMAGDGSAPVPVSREERFMADIVSGESSGLSPLTAEERALNGLVGKIGGGGDSGFGTAEVTITNNAEYEASVYGYLTLVNVDENISVIMTAAEGASITDTPVIISTYYDANKHSAMVVDGGFTISDCVGCEIIREYDGITTIAITDSVASFSINAPI